MSQTINQIPKPVTSQPMEYFEFRGQNGLQAICGLNIDINPTTNQVQIIVTELTTNPGMSVTNQIEWIANLIYKTCIQPKNLPISNIKWIESYEENIRFDRTSNQEVKCQTWDEVFFTFHNGRFSNPSWKFLTFEKLEE